MIRRLLIANRGEIALRIVRACRELGIETVAVYSDADAASPHVRAADTAVRLGPAPPRESYLKVDALLDAARSTGADAVHPGYGFLSERALRPRLRGCGARLRRPARLRHRVDGIKVGARSCRRPACRWSPARPPPTRVTPPWRRPPRVGLPILVKPSAGGGGIGMKVVRETDALAGALAQARREAQAAFGDGTLYVERLVERPRHVEVQVFADAHGGVVHLFERECSVQRRHQKIIEESPSPALTPALRSRMGEAAVAAARAAGYRNAGTVEFLLEGDGDDARFYFLEMNTRLQVEHPVTEAVTGVDLVQAQLRVASGEPLPWTQADLSQRGHAIECRVYAEDPARGDLPEAGRLSSTASPPVPASASTAASPRAARYRSTTIR
ncbi:MAG: biotin carboxylase N-terminal domain-containing protein [Vicinamibacterales bacterium]